MVVDSFSVWDGLREISCFLYRISNTRILEQTAVYTSQTSEDILDLTQIDEVCVSGPLLTDAF